MDISGHRKIELQSPLDLSYLRANITRSAREKLDLNLPPAPGEGEDKLRKRVEELVDEVRYYIPLRASEEGRVLEGVLELEG